MSKIKSTNYYEPLVKDEEIIIDEDKLITKINKKYSDEIKKEIFRFYGLYGIKEDGTI
jgi:hypothetical protein